MSRRGAHAVAVFGAAALVSVCSQRAVADSLVQCRNQSDCVQFTDSCTDKQGTCVDGNCDFAPRLCALGKACIDGNCVSSPLRFSVEPLQSSTTYSPGFFYNEGLRFKAVITNVSHGDVAVCVNPEAAVRINRVTVDGKAIAPSGAIAMHQRRGRDETAVQTLKPGESANFEIVRLVTVLSSGPALKRIVGYDGRGPGTYSFAFVYRCRGPALARPDIFKGTVSSTPVEIRLEANHESSSSASMDKPAALANIGATSPRIRK